MDNTYQNSQVKESMEDNPINFPSGSNKEINTWLGNNLEENEKRGFMRIDNNQNENAIRAIQDKGHMEDTMNSDMINGDYQEFEKMDKEPFSAEDVNEEEVFKQENEMCEILERIKDFAESHEMCEEDVQLELLMDGSGRVSYWDETRMKFDSIYELYSLLKQYKKK